ncbi:MAG: hypothetical protein HDQ88_08725 [Clostridia bacterium]|nr:hypothetical protein [Clostridia bacterium]
MELDWTIRMDAFVYDSTTNCVLEGYITTISETKTGERKFTLKDYVCNQTFTVRESELHRTWESAYTAKQDAIKQATAPVKDLQSLMELIESIIYDPTTKMTDCNRNLIVTAIAALRDGG